jgi:acetaldehyde dehydrogenase (acetylating)
MTLGCGAMAGNITSDNVGPQHLINIKRIAWKVRNADEALKIPPEWQDISDVRPAAATVDRETISAMVEQYLAQRGVKVSGQAPTRSAALSNVAAEIVDRFLGSHRRSTQPPVCPANCPSRPPQPASEPPGTPEPPPAPKVEVAPFVCENDVRMAMQRSAKIYIGPKSIVTPSARDLGEQHGILVLTQE